MRAWLRNSSEEKKAIRKASTFAYWWNATIASLSGGRPRIKR
jgi:hypothetical protein